MKSFASIVEAIHDLEINPIEAHGNIYHPIPFAEFSHLKTSSNEKGVAEKLHLIRSALSAAYGDLSGVRVLDIGANAGFFTFSLAQQGAEVVAFEPHPRYAQLGKLIAEEKRLAVRWHGVPFDGTLVEGRSFDAGLMLSVFQWMANGGDDMDAAVTQLRHISQQCRYLFFELGFNKGAACLRTRRVNHYAALIDLLRTSTAYQHFKLLGRISVWRRAPRYLVLCSNDPELEDRSLRRLLRQFPI